ncbi:MAG: uracil-DNA glycosylase [Gammaproteobacteria bacterium]|nr:uracil-DNA glycosylase [Gammaproteobacteria bacterium]MCK5499366.1 uracil-DNA glycosylase [Gammaproteobacteria bacterium]
MGLTQTQEYYLQTMGVDVYWSKDREIVDPVSETVVNEGDSWADLRQRVAKCQQCELHQGRTQTVFGVGDHNADWLIIGEAPGAEEDRQGEPFVGRAGKLLNSMLFACGMQREQVFIANILKCRPPNNRDPKPEEVVACSSYLKEQIDLLQPKIILAVGRIAAQNLMQTETPIGKMRGQRYQYADTGIPVVVTYHPAYLLRSPREKRKAWQDLQLAMRVYQETA